MRDESRITEGIERLVRIDQHLRDAKMDRQTLVKIRDGRSTVSVRGHVSEEIESIDKYRQRLYRERAKLKAEDCNGKSESDT